MYKIEKTAEKCCSTVVGVNRTKYMGEDEAQSWDMLPVPVLKSAAASFTTFDPILCYMYYANRQHTSNNIHPFDLVFTAELVRIYIFALFQHH